MLALGFPCLPMLSLAYPCFHLSCSPLLCLARHMRGKRRKKEEPKRFPRFSICSLTIPCFPLLCFFVFSVLFPFWFPDLPSLSFVFPCFLLLSLALLFSGAGTDAGKNLECQSSMPGLANFFFVGTACTGISYKRSRFPFIC